MEIESISRKLLGSNASVVGTAFMSDCSGRLVGFKANNAGRCETFRVRRLSRSYATRNGLEMDSLTTRGALSYGVTFRSVLDRKSSLNSEEHDCGCWAVNRGRGRSRGGGVLTWPLYDATTALRVPRVTCV